MKKLSCANNWISWILGLGIIPFFIARFFLMKWEYATCWWVTALFMIIPIAFLVWKVIYLKAYLKDIKAEGKEKLSVWLLSGSTALLISGAYFAIIGFYGLLNPYLYIIPLTLFMIIKVVGMIYDFLSNSEIFIGIKHDTFLEIALFIVYIFFAVNSTSNIMIYFAKILAIVLSILLTALVLKSCLLDKLSFKDHKTIMNFLLVAVLAVGISVYTIYLWFWKKDGTEQALFSAVMGIYAAVLGGAITLGGVAWTIRRQDEIRNDEEKKKAKPFFRIITIEEEDVSTAYNNSIEFISKQPKEGDWPRIFIGLENTDKCPFYIDKIKVNNTYFYPKGKSFVNKSEIFSLLIVGNIENPHDSEEIYLYITDCFYNERVLRLNTNKEAAFKIIEEVS